MQTIKTILNLLLVVMPWFLRRRLLIWIYNYKLHPTSRIGLSYIYPKYLEMGENAQIDHFTVGIHLDRIIIGAKSSIGRGNWITGFPSGTTSLHFKHQSERCSELNVGTNSAITKNHHIDCTNKIQIGDFVTIAGYNSQLLTHSINIIENRQDSAPIIIGDYCFVGTNAIILGGSILPSYSILGAKSLLNKTYMEEWKLYGGNPAKPIKKISEGAKYFHRTEGFVF